MQDFTTPMMQQYGQIKKQYQDCLLFYRMGDFYELFMEDAYIGAKVLNITLTSRPKGKDGRIPMAGVPFHAVDNYLAKLVQAGYKVAICEQITPPNKYQIIERDVVRIVTPGTVLDEKALPKSKNNYIISLTLDDKHIGLSVADISTGYFGTSIFDYTNLSQKLRDELAKLNPSECILPVEVYNNPEILKILKTEQQMNISFFSDWDKYAKQATNYLKKHFKIHTLDSFGVDTYPLNLQSAAALLGYLEQTQKTQLIHIKKIVKLSDNQVTLDRSTILNLELFSTLRDRETAGSLFHTLDMTKTAMGGRLLRSWINQPLKDIKEIDKRHSAVEFFLKESRLRKEITDLLNQIYDIERLLSRMSVGLGNAKDLVNLKYTLKTILEIKDLFPEQTPKVVQMLIRPISKDLNGLISLIEDHIVDDPPFALKEGGLIKKGIHKELDSLRELVTTNKNWVLNLESSEKEKTGIGSLKVGFNQVFGFYIEVSKSNLSMVPDNYIRKQTLVNGERFITPELKEKEEIILSAEEKINALEYQIFLNILKQILDKTEILQQTAKSIAVLDCLINFATVSDDYHYQKPVMNTNGLLKIKNGRHPVVEHLLDENQFVPNSIEITKNSPHLFLITGPNMAGKSVLIRQVALIVLMAQIGCFVPAERAEISIVDQIFVRSGASDAITSGLSTFMVEMVETAHILNNATEKSLIVMDEIGRGTSTYDGISIAWAVAEYLVTKFKNPPITLFATHYHELQELEHEYPNLIKNYHMSVVEDQGQPIFLHTLQQGGASHSFGVAVAQLAGVPESVIKKASKLLHQLEGQHHQDINQIPKVGIIQSELNKLNLEQMTPLEALNKLADLKSLQTNGED